MSRGARHDGRIYSGLDAEARKAERRTRLLDAGLEEYGTVGFNRTPITTLCATAGITSRHFYEAFGTQDELLVALYQQLVDEIDVAVRTAIERSTTPETSAMGVIRLATETLFQEMLGDKRRARIVCVEVMSAREPSTVIHTGMDRLHAVIDGFYRMLAPSAGLTPPVDPSAEVLGWAVAGAIRELLLIGLTRPDDAGFEDLVQAVTVVAARAFELPTEAPLAIVDR